MTPGMLCRALAARHAAALAFVDGSRSVSFADFDAATDRVAAFLRGRGLARGDRVAVLMRDGLPLLEIYFACAKLDLIAVPLNWRLSATEVGSNLERAKPALLFVSERFAVLAGAAGSQVEVVPEERLNALPYSTQQTSADISADKALAPVPWLMLFTSGTTGRPKGCLLSQQGQMAAARVLALTRGLAATDRLLSTAPLFHVGGFSALLSHMIAGAATVFAPHPLSAAEWLRLVSEEGCTSASLMPSLRAEVLALRARLNPPLRLRHVSTAGTTLMNRADFEAQQAAFAEELVVGYGQTEAGGFVAQMRGAEQLYRLDACGKLLSHLVARVIDAAGIEVPTGEAGELCLRGASVMLGYWGDPQADAEALHDGWLRTGDLVRFDQQGYLRFVGRNKELIKSGGENVYPAEVEQALMTHPAVADCAVAGVPDARWGEAVKAFVVFAAGATLTKEEVVSWCRERLAGYKRPRYVEFLETIPRGALGKTDRLELARRPIDDHQAVSAASCVQASD